jgi:Zn-dependent peptidase ImmA (M78 family)
MQLTWADAEEIAEAERSSLGLNGQPIKDICDLLESKRGIKIFHLPENPDKFFGAFTNDESYGACFLINSNNPSRRRTFTIAHEYAHCIAHRNQLAHIDYRQSFEDKDHNERFANAFAAAFLMPKGTTIEVLNQLKSTEQSTISLIIIQLAIYFGVSYEAAGWRLVGLRKLSGDKWNDIQSQHIPSTPIAKFLGYDEQGIEPQMLPSQYKFFCYHAYNRKLISFERLAELLSRNFYELQSELGAAER